MKYTLQELMDMKGTSEPVRHALQAMSDEIEALRQGAERKPLTEKNAHMMALLLDEAAANLAALMETPQAKALGVRHFLPDELNGCAIMLREAYGVPAA